MEQQRAEKPRLQFWIFRMTGAAHPGGAQLSESRAPGSPWHISLMQFLHIIISSHLQTLCSQAGLFCRCNWGSLSVYAVFLFCFSSLPLLSSNLWWQEVQTIPCCPPADVRAWKRALGGKGDWGSHPSQQDSLTQECKDRWNSVLCSSVVPERTEGAGTV